MSRAHLVVALFVSGIVAACNVPSSDATVVTHAPDRAQFPLVAQLLVHRCGSLDCHGQQERNLRLFGKEGMRLSPTDVPGVQDTSDAEIDEDYWSVVDLEPETMSAVVAAGGAYPERLTLVRKARGTEKHAGGGRFVAGDPQDRCLLSWLAGAVDPGACGQALVLY
jgi:hypothetical protein